MLKDRFGKLPKQVHELFNGLRLRWICKQMGFDRLSLKSRKLRCYFVSNPQSTFYEGDFFNAALQYVSTRGIELGLSIKQSRNFLIIIKEDVKNLKEAKILLSLMLEEIRTILKEAKELQVEEA